MEGREGEKRGQGGKGGKGREGRVERHKGGNFLFSFPLYGAPPAKTVSGGGGS
jgi:hypothetical protein